MSSALPEMFKKQSTSNDPPLRILWVTPQLPSLRSGGQVRQFHLIRHLCRHNKVTVLSLVKAEEQGDVARLRDLNATVHSVAFKPEALPGKWINRLRSWGQLIFDTWPQFAHVYPIRLLELDFRKLLSELQPDIIHIELLFAAPLGKMAIGVPWVLCEQNVESQNLKRQFAQETRLLRQLYGQLETHKLQKWEIRWLRACSAGIAVSQDDLVTLQDMVGGKPIAVVPNGVDTAGFAPPHNNIKSRQGLLFFGNLGYRPNQDALHYFCQEILPVIRHIYPDVELQILGPHATSDILALNTLLGVQVIGCVPDIRPHLWQSAVCVAPLRSGGGTRLKILEAMAAGLPVVSSTTGAEGLQVVHDEHLLLADTPEEFARAVIRLLHDKSLAGQLSQKACTHVQTNYDWESIAARLLAFYHQIISSRIP